MKTTMKLLLIVAALFIGGITNAQERPMFLTVTTIHWNMDMNDFSMDDWKALEKEYFDKVTMKNDYIVHSNVLMHYFTADNSELKIVTGYRSWEDIEKAQDRSDELEKEGWPDEAARKAFFQKRGAYYSKTHSDEIYSTLDGAKVLAEKPEKPMIYYVRVSHLAYPQGGTAEEMSGLRKEFVDNVINNNSYVKGYYPSRHAWGSNGQDFVEAFVFESLADLEKSFDVNQNLIKAHWPDETKRKEYFDKADKYFTGWHGDYIYRHVPELVK